MQDINKEQLNTNFYNNIFLIFFCLSPFTLIFNGITDVFTGFLSLIGVYYLIRYNFFSKKVFNIQYIIPLIFYLYIVVNSYYSSEDFTLSIKNSIIYIRFIIVYFLICELLKNDYFKNNLLGNLKIILIFWFLAGLFISIDILYQFYSDYSLFGHKSIDNRLSGPFEELVAGKFLGIFFLILSVIPLLYFRINYLIILGYVFFLLIIILITGERMAFLNTIFVIMLFFLFGNDHFSKKIKLLITVFFVFSSSLIIYLNKDLYDRNVTQTINQIFGNTNVSAEKSYFLDHYGILYLTAFEIIKQHPFLGTGQKTYRIECAKDDYNFIENKNLRCSTHPHNYYLELFSENGLIGIILFISTLFIIIKRYLRYDILMNRYTLFLLIVFLNPLQITGRLTNTWISSTMWVLIYFMILFSYYEKKK